MSGDETIVPGGGPTLEEMSREDCFRLLASQFIGRVAVAEFGSAPLVVPVNFLLDGEAVVFRTDYGSKFRLAVLGEHPVSFEVDGIDRGSASGWSVLVQGAATEIEESEWERHPLRAWAPGSKRLWVRIMAEVISGRRIQLAPYPGSSRDGYR